MALFVIYGNMNSGKTHTCWLVYTLLKNAGKEIDFEPKGLPNWTFSDVLQHINDRFVSPSTTPQASDFRALIEYKDKKIAIFSAGDYLHDENWEVTSFDDNMNWAQNKKADHVICCSRSRNNQNSVRNSLLDNYRMSIYRWYWKDILNSLQDQISEAQRVAVELYSDIKANC